MSFDADAQEAFLADIDMGRFPSLALFFGAIAGVVVVLVIFITGMRFRTRSHGERVKALYEKFCRRAARRGATREPWEGPSHFAIRAARLLPNESDRIQRVTNGFVTLRYSPDPAPAVFEQFARDVAGFAGAKPLTRWRPPSRP